MLKKASHIGLIILLLVSTMGMTVNLHFSQNKLYDAKFFLRAESCCMPSGSIDKEDMDFNNTVNIQHESDCKDETINIEPVNDFLVSDQSFEFNKVSFINLFSYSIYSVFSLLNIADKEYPELYIPPPEKQVVLSLLQTYLL